MAAWWAIRTVSQKFTEDQHYDIVPIYMPWDIAGHVPSHR